MRGQPLLSQGGPSPKPNLPPNPRPSGFHEKDGKAYCRKDYFDMFAPKCGGCARAILENYISALNTLWHPECFVCRVRSPVASSGEAESGRCCCRPVLAESDLEGPLEVLDQVGRQAAHPLKCSRSWTRACAGASRNESKADLCSCPWVRPGPGEGDVRVK